MKRDLGGQERVRRDLDQLGGGEVGHHDRRARPRSPARTRPAASASAAADCTPNTSRSGCRVSSTAKPSRRNSGFQATSTSCRRGQRGRPARTSAARCRPAPSTCPPPARAGSSSGASVENADSTYVRSAAYPSLRCGVPTQTKCTSANSRHLLVRGGEPQPAGVQRLAQQLRQPGLEERHLAGAEPGDLRLVDVQPDHVVAELDHGHGVGRAEVSGAEHRQLRPGAVVSESHRERVRHRRRRPGLARRSGGADRSVT